MGRLHVPGGCYHLIGRGLECRYIFADDADKRDFLDRLGKSLVKTDCQCLAWALMSNHYHLLVRAGPLPLSKLMAPVLGGYGGYYSHRHGRASYVFQNRFKSILCQEDSYLLELVGYIHLNPIRASTVLDLFSLRQFVWTGHAGMLGYRKQSWHDADAVLRLFGHTRRRARAQYLGFMRAGIDNPNPRSLSGGELVRSCGSWEALGKLRREHTHCIGDERILGDSDFASEMLEGDSLGLKQATLRTRQGWTLEKLICSVCHLCDIQERLLLKKARNNNHSKARALICYWGTAELVLATSEIARRLEISQQAVSKWVSKGQVLADSLGLRFPSTKD